MMRRIGMLARDGVARLWTLVHRHSPRVWLLWACGILALAALPISLMDPAVLVLVLDPELLALIVVSVLGLVRVSLARAPEREQS
jgi:hypothetical protein